MTPNTPRANAETYPGWIKVDDDTPWHTDRQEWTKAGVARELERELQAAQASIAALRELVRIDDEDVTGLMCDCASDLVLALETARTALAIPAAKQSGERDARRYGIARTLMKDGTLGDLEIDSPEAFDAAIDAMLQANDRE